jgi:hypothetical protein
MPNSAELLRPRVVVIPTMTLLLNNLLFPKTGQ